MADNAGPGRSTAAERSSADAGRPASEGDAVTTDRLASDRLASGRLARPGGSSGEIHPTAAPRLGTFLGVFTPTILTILGVIMYLRFGWVIGNLGVLGAVAVVLVANAVTFTTALSFSAVATNTRVGVGGAYYMISRSLGPEVGGAIGLPLFLSQAFSVTLYAFGLAESLRFVWPTLPVVPAAFVVVLAVGLLAYFGANAALRAQLPLMAMIVISLIALTGGALFGQPVTAVPVGATAQAAASAPSPGFWVVFAVFFPAVTGIMAGLGLSGDLKDPARSIPRGAIAATIVGAAVYLVVPFLLVRGASAEVLRADPLVWTRIAPYGAWLVLPGLWGAIFSSAVGSVLGAPRTLQALAMDELAPKKLVGPASGEGEPVLGLAVTIAIALGAVLLGDLNAVAPVVSMFFLTVYGMINLVAALETVSGDPSWRPRIRVPWPISLAGALGCFAVMILIHAQAAALAIAVELLLWGVLARRGLRADWGDARRGIFETVIRWSLVKLRRRPMTPRSWRPHILIFVDDVARRRLLVHFGCWFAQGRGVVTVSRLVVGDLLDQDLHFQDRQQELQTALDDEGLVAFAEVAVVDDVVGGMSDVAQANGMAGLHSNTVLLGWPSDVERLVEYVTVLRRLNRLGKSVVLARLDERSVAPVGRRARVDVWWGGLYRNADLMLLLAHLLTRNPAWRRGRIRVISLARDEEMRAHTTQRLQEVMDDARIEAKLVVRLYPKNREIHEVILEESGRSDVVFLGLSLPSAEGEREYAARYDKMARNLRTVFFVHNASPFGGELVSPE